MVLQSYHSDINSVTQRPPPILHHPYAGGTTHCCAARNEIAKSNRRKTMQYTMDTRKEKCHKQAVRQAEKTNENTRQGDNRGSYANEQRGGATNKNGCRKGRAGGRGAVRRGGSSGATDTTDTCSTCHPPLYFITSLASPPACTVPVPHIGLSAQMPRDAVYTQ